MERTVEGPPPWVIEAARVAAMASPCQKSKRGAAVYNVEECDDILEGRARLRAEYAGRIYDADREARYKQDTIVDVACNAPPEGWSCTGSEACRKNCGKLCRHAEERAIHAAGALTTVEALALVHVKVVDGQVVAGGPPSCWQCSRLIADCGVRGIWLYEGVSGNTSPGIWRFYGAKEFHQRTLEHEGMVEPTSQPMSAITHALTSQTKSTITHAYVSAGDVAGASGDRPYTGCYLCGQPRSEHPR